MIKLQRGMYCPESAHGQSSDIGILHLPRQSERIPDILHQFFSHIRSIFTPCLRAIQIERILPCRTYYSQIIIPRQFADCTSRHPIHAVSRISMQQEQRLHGTSVMRILHRPFLRQIIREHDLKFHKSL